MHGYKWPINCTRTRSREVGGQGKPKSWLALVPSLPALYVDGLIVVRVGTGGM